jgi:hypothetical protein
LCSAALAHEHSHLIELTTRQILCACEPCSTLFDSSGRGRYRRVSRRAWFLPDLKIEDAQWDALMIPISMAFFFHSSPQGKMVALYPSPAGAIESLLPADAWFEIAEENPVLGEMQPDIEALLVNRIGHARASAPAEYYMAPIDECFRLVGLIRMHWKGLSGGNEVWEEIARFFSALKSRADSVRGERFA